MLMTILEAQVQADKSATLEREYNHAIQKLDEGMVATFLVHHAADANMWRIITIWSSRETLNARRALGNTPRDVLIFRAAGAEPTLSVWDVPAHASIR